MSRLVVIALTCGAIASLAPAHAADLPVKAPMFSPAPAFSWTGLYIGANAGGGRGGTNFTWNSNPAGFGGTALAAGLNSLGNNSISGSGFVGGGQIGYNYQLQYLVLGLESDLDYTGLRGSLSNAVIFPGALTPGTINESFDSHWLATVRGRLGFTTGPLLVYGTGGLAVANVSYNDFVFFNATGTFNAASANATQTGWTVGGGAEWSLAPQWSVKAEYLYVDLGNTTSTSANSQPAFFPLATILHDHRLTEGIARLGMNYKFDWGAPAVARY